MTSTRLKCALLALPLLIAAGPAFAFGQPEAEIAAPVRTAFLGGLFDRGNQVERSRRPDIQLAQSSDPRVVSLEEQVRNLNGKIEELNFLILQMQEQMRKQQEDIDFRFQEIEGGGGSASGTTERRTEADPVETAPATTQSPSQTAGIPQTPPASGNQPTVAGVIDGTATPNADGSLPGVPQNLGSIRFDERGNLIGGATTEAPVELLDNNAQQPASGGQTEVASLPSTDDPEELYRNSYEFILGGDYKAAETGFRSYIERFPNARRVADANFWLGESLAGQNRHRDAAEIYLAASRDHPESKKAPDTLLKLGMSLAAMKQREVACATFREVNTRYPNASDALKERVRQEVATNGC